MAWQNQIPVLGAFLPDPEEEALQKQFARMAEAYRQYRPQLANSQNTKLGSQLAMFGPVQEALSQAYPSISPFDVGGAQQGLYGVTQGLGIAGATRRPK